jgi:glycosyltransferase involved in cell wall biosynthesis
MKILHIISSGGMYGAEAVILNLCRILAAGHEHQGILGVFANSSQPNIGLHETALRAGLESHLIPCRGQFDPAVPAAIRKLARSTSADVVHAHGYKADVYTWLALRRQSAVLVSTCHTWYDNDLAVRAYGALDRWALRNYDAVIAVSDEVRSRLIRAGIETRRVHQIRNGIDLRPFADAPEQRRRRRESGGDFRVGLVGRLAPEKGVDIFLRAASEVLREYPTTEFIVAGDGPDRRELEQLRTTLGLDGKVSLPGQQSDMPGFYASIDLLVSASRKEGLPIALLEGMASGLPIVATAVGQVPEVIDAESVGRIVQPGNASEIAAAIKQFLRDAPLCVSVGTAARNRVAAEFSADRMTAEYMRVYQQALSGAAR